MLADALGCNIRMGMPSRVVALPQVRGGEFRALATGSKERLSELPDVPTLNELGLQMSAVTWYGLMVRRDTPDAAVAALSAAVRAASQDQKVRTSMRGEGAIPVFSDPAAFERDAREEAQAVKPLLEKYQIGRAPSELQSLMRISYAVFCLKKKKQIQDYKKHKITNSTTLYTTI